MELGDQPTIFTIRQLNDGMQSAWTEIQLKKLSKRKGKW